MGVVIICFIRFKEAESLVNLYILCWPDSSFVSSLPEATPTELELIKVSHTLWFPNSYYIYS